MSKLEHAKNLDLSSLGYEHPTSHRRNNTNPYKTLNTDEENATYQSNTTSINPYSNISEQEDYKEECCPICKEPALYVCDCTEFGEMLCSKGHYWWMDENGRYQIGDPHQSNPK